MPNHVRQQLTIDGERPRKVIGYMSGRTPFDFNRAVPMPEDLAICESLDGQLVIDVLTGNCAKHLDYPWVKVQGIATTEDFRTYFEAHRPATLQLARQYMSNEAKYGHRTWYTWCRQNWGTKWNAYNISRPEVAPRRAVICFDTPWSPAIPVIARLSELFPRIEFILRYFDEGFFFAGTARFMHGEMSNESFKPKPGDPRTQETYRHVYGIDLELEHETE